MTNKRARLKDLDLSGSDVFFDSAKEKKDEEKAKNKEPETKVMDNEPDPEQFSPSKPVRATFYFYPEQLDELEEIRLQIRRDHKIKTDKSSIVRIAVSEALTNYRKNKDNNILKKNLQTS